jgi:RHS repeat-associated protein
VTLRQKLIYGDDTTDGPSTPTDKNHLGKLFQHYDEAGLVTLEEYDFKGNVLQKKREVIADSEIKAVFDGPPTDWEVPVYRVDWDNSITLEGEYITDMGYDALNRMKKMVYPEDEDTERKELIPTYNNAGALEKVTMDGDSYVEHIAYNAKGQRLLIAFGNDVMTRYTYDANTFRLSRMKSEKYTIDPDTPWTFEYASGTNRQDIGFDYDLNGNIIRRRERRTDCGITGSQLGADALDRNFSYDPLNRLLSASGRESNTQNQNDYTYTTSPRLDNYPDEPSSNPNANNVRSYTRNYAYDKMGNIQSMAHSASGNSFTRNFSYETGKNRLEEIETGGAVTIEAYTYDSNGNQITAGTTRNYEWDHSDQLRCYYNQTGTAAPTIYAHYLYDAAGNRVKKLVRTSSTNWQSTIYIDGVFEHQKIETSTDTYERDYLHIMDDKSRIAQRRVGTSFPDDISEDIFYVLDDHLGSSSVRLNDSSGAVIDREEYYPFGDSSLRTFSKKRYRYIGKEKDAESGLYYYGARYYSAWTCRFISVDQLAANYAQLTPYNYANNGPVDDFDIDGNQDNETTTSPKGNSNNQLSQSEVNAIEIFVNNLPESSSAEGKTGGEKKSSSDTIGLVSQNDIDVYKAGVTINGEGKIVDTKAQNQTYDGSAYSSQKFSVSVGPQIEFDIEVPGVMDIDVNLNFAALTLFEYESITDNSGSRTNVKFLGSDQGTSVSQKFGLGLEIGGVGGSASWEQSFDVKSLYSGLSNQQTKTSFGTMNLEYSKNWNGATGEKSTNVEFAGQKFDFSFIIGVEYKNASGVTF